MGLLSGSTTTTSGSSPTYAEVAISGLVTNRVLISDGSTNPKVTYSSATATEASYLSGVTSSIQTQLNGKLDSSSLSLQSAYAGGNTIVTSGGNSVVIDGSESLQIKATNGIELFNTAETFRMRIKAHATMLADFTLVLPIDDGLPSQLLQTDGSGNLSWITPAVATPTLQEIYDNDPNGGDVTVTTNATDGKIVIAGTESLSVTATGGITTGIFVVDDLTLNGNSITSSSGMTQTASGQFQLTTTGSNNILLSPGGTGRIKFQGVADPLTDATYNLGTALTRWGAVYISGFLSDGTSNVNSDVLVSLRDINTGVANNDLIAWDSGTSKWVNTSDPILTSATVDNIFINLNTISTTTGTLTLATTAGNLFLSPVSGNVRVTSSAFLSDVNGATQLGGGSNRFSDLYLAGSITDGTTAISMTTLVSLFDINNGVATNDLINWNGTKWVNTSDPTVTSIVIDNLTIDGNTISSTSGNVIISPVTSSTFIGGHLRQNLAANTYDIGETTTTWRKLFIANAISNGTNEILISELLALRNNQFRDAARTLPVQNGDTLVYDTVSSTFLASAGGGTGDTTGLIETIKNTLNDSLYEFVTPNVFLTDESDLVDSSTGTLDSGSYVLDAAEYVKSIQMLDDDFLNEEVDVSSVQLLVKWKTGFIDTAATYEVSRRGDVAPYQTVTMERIGETDTFVGKYDWTDEETTTFTEESIAASAGTALTNDAGVSSKVAQRFTLGQDTLVTSLGVYLNKVGSPTGNYVVSLYSSTTSGGSIALPNDASILYSSASQSVAALTTSITRYDFATSLQLSVGTYWVVVTTDATYKAAYVASTTQMQWNTLAGGFPNGARFNVSVWQDSSAHQGYRVASTAAEYFASLATYSQANQTATLALNATTNQKLSQAFTLTSASSVKRVTAYLRRATTASVGKVYVQIIRDSAGDPSTSSADILADSGPIDILGFFTANVITAQVDMPDIVLNAGTYHIVLSTDAAYKAATMDLSWYRDETSPPAPNQRAFNGTTWSAASPAGTATYIVEGRALDLRVKITSSASNRKLDGYGIYYDLASTGSVTGIKNRQVFSFAAVADNDNEFELTAFTPDPDLLNVYYIEKGQVFKYPSFVFSGNTVVFPVNTFNNGGIEATVTLVFDQTTGNSFDSSDLNGLLLASNFLGSTDPNIDRSSTGRGIFLRNANGVLREIALDASDNVVVYTIP